MGRNTEITMEESVYTTNPMTESAASFNDRATTERLLAEGCGLEARIVTYCDPGKTEVCDASGSVCVNECVDYGNGRRPTTEEVPDPKNFTTTKNGATQFVVDLRMPRKSQLFATSS